MSPTTFIYMTLLLPSVVVTTGVMVAGIFTGSQALGILTIAALAIAYIVRRRKWCRFLGISGRSYRWPGSSSSGLPHGGSSGVPRPMSAGLDVIAGVLRPSKEKRSRIARGTKRAARRARKRRTTSARSRSAAMMVGLLLVIITTGCSTTPRTVYVQPDAEPAPRPSIDLDRRALWDALEAEQNADGQCVNDGCRMYRSVEDTIDSLIDWGLENEAVLKSLNEE